MGVRPLAVEFPDVRGGDRHLRLSWHSPQRQAVLSQWRDGVCVATTPLPLEALPRLSAFVTEALTEAAHETAPLPPPTVASVARDSRTVARTVWQRWWDRRRRAPVIRLPERRR